MTAISEQEYITRIHQLEALNKTLAEQVDRMMVVVGKVESYINHDRALPLGLIVTFREYQRQMAQLAKERE